MEEGKNITEENQYLKENIQKGINGMERVMIINQIKLYMK